MPFVRRMTASWAALCGLAFAYGFAVMYGLEKEVPTMVPSEPMVRLSVWTWSGGAKALALYLLLECDEVPCLVCRAAPYQSCARAKTW